MSKVRKKLIVFICAAREDVSLARRIHQKLGEQGWIRPWLYTEDIQNGQKWESAISVAMTQAHAFIVCLSRESVVKPGYFQKEIKDALKRQDFFPDGTIVILPVKLSDCDPPQDLKHLQYLEFFEAEKAFGKLLQSLELRARYEKVKITRPSSPVKPHEIEEYHDSAVLWGSRQNEYDNMPKKLVELILDEDISYFDVTRQNTVRFVLSKLLNVEEKYIVLKTFMEGSVKVILEIPESLCADLTDLAENTNSDLHRLFRVKSFDISEKVPLFITKNNFEKGEAGFIGREAELNKIREVVQVSGREKRIALILGPEGTGKTLILNKILIESRQAGFLSSHEPIDLFFSEYHHIHDLQGKIVEIIRNFTDMAAVANPFQEWRRGDAHANEMFHDSLMEFCSRHPLLLAFDALENLDKVSSDWLFSSGQDGLQVPGLICVIAGRDQLNEERLDGYRKNPLVTEINISGLSLKETEDLYQTIENESAGPLGDDLLSTLGLSSFKPIEDGIERIWQITEGNPLRLEMAFRWSRNSIDEIGLVRWTPEKYEERLMEYVCKWGMKGELPVGRLLVGQTTFNTILCMAYVVRRFDIKFLQFFIDERIIQFSEDMTSKEELLDNLMQYFFIRVRNRTEYGPEIIQLHDEMARLVRKYVWPFVDRSGEMREEIFRATVRFYDKLIKDLSRTSKSMAEILLVEQLYYMLQLDPKGAGLNRWNTLAELRNANINKLLPGEIDPYLEEYDLETQILIRHKIAQMVQGTDFL